MEKKSKQSSIPEKKIKNEEDYQINRLLNFLRFHGFRIISQNQTILHSFPTQNQYEFVLANDLEVQKKLDYKELPPGLGDALAFHQDMSEKQIQYISRLRAHVLIWLYLCKVMQKANLSHKFYSKTSRFHFETPVITNKTQGGRGHIEDVFNQSYCLKRYVFLEHGRKTKKITCSCKNNSWEKFCVHEWAIQTVCKKLIEDNTTLPSELIELIGDFSGSNHKINIQDLVGPKKI